VPGWNEYVYEAKAAASDAHYLWCQWNKPKFGPLFDLMRRTRAKYKYARYAIAVNRKNKFRLILWLSLCLNRTSVLFGAKSPKQSLHLCPTLLYSRPGHCIFLLWRYSSFIIVLYFCIYVPAFEADASDGSNEDDNSNDADCTDNDDYQQNVFIDR